MSQDDILVEVADNIGKIVFNRPEVFNAYSRSLAQGLTGAVRRLAADPAVAVIIITGAGKAFMSGADLNMIKELGGLASPVEVRHHLETLFDPNCLADLPKPTIAAVNGLAFGMGLEIALACDFRVALDRARFALPEITLGLIPGGGGSQRLTKMIGPARALEMISLGRPMGAEEAQRLGLVNRVAPREEFWPTVEALAGDLAAKSREALHACKRLVHHGGELPLRDGVAYERELFSEIVLSPDAAEGVSAFLGKRKPVFNQG